MKLSRISFLFLLLFMFVPLAVSAQSEAEKSWNPFWTKFTTAVKAKNITAILKLTVSENNFSNGGGAGSRKQLIKESLNFIRDSVGTGTMIYNNGSQPARRTKNGALVFEYINKRWWFVGFMGD